MSPLVVLTPVLSNSYGNAVGTTNIGPAPTPIPPATVSPPASGAGTGGDAGSASTHPSTGNPMGADLTSVLGPDWAWLLAAGLVLIVILAIVLAG